MGDYELIMPFLPVESQGGPFDDLAYTAGFEMGQLYAQLNQTDAPPIIELAVHRDNHKQADLIAMRYNYVTEVRHDDGHGWVNLLFRRGATP